ncbi:unnamed protein product [Musa textilis]
MLGDVTEARVTSPRLWRRCRSLGRRPRGSGDVAEASGDVPEGRATSPKPRATSPRVWRRRRSLGRRPRGSKFKKKNFFFFSGDVTSGATSPVDTSGDVAEGDVVEKKKIYLYLYIYNIYNYKYIYRAVRFGTYRSVPLPYRTRETSKLRYGTVWQTLHEITLI